MGGRGKPPGPDRAERAWVTLNVEDAVCSSVPATLGDLFTIQAGLRPLAVALTFRDQRLTYGALETVSNRLAHVLIQLGAGPETLVALAFEPSIELVVAMLAVLKTGAAYVPLDPSSPPERTGFIVADCGAGIVLSTQAVLARLAFGDTVRTVALDDPAQAAVLETSPARRPAPDNLAPDNLAYVIYTSDITVTVHIFDMFICFV